MTEGNASSGRHSSTSSDHSIDPNDKYRVFRAQPEVTSITAAPSMDSKDRFGVFQSGDQPVMTTGPQSSDVPLFQGGVGQQSSGWNRTDASSTGGQFQSFTPNKVINNFI